MNELKFSLSGEAVWIEFDNGAETFECQSKEEALKMLIDLSESGKIEEDEKHLFTHQIILSDNLPIFSKQEVIDLFVELMGGNVLVFQKKTIKDPRFEICECGELPCHGYVYDDEGNSIEDKLTTKADAEMLIDYMLETDIITEESHNSLKVLIDLSPLLEDASLN